MLCLPFVRPDQNAGRERRLLRRGNPSGQVHQVARIDPHTSASQAAPQGPPAPAAVPRGPPAPAESGTTAAPGGNISDGNSGSEQSSHGHGKPPRLSHLPPVRHGKPLTGFSPSALRRTANPPSILVSARQTPTPFSSCGSERLGKPLSSQSSGRTANPPSVPLAARQTPPGKASFLSSRQTTAAHQGGYRLVPLDLPPRTTRQEPQPWSRRHPRPCDPRVRATRSPRGPVTPGTSEDPCPTKDESIEALLGQLRLPPLLSPLKESPPRHLPGDIRKPTRPERVGAPRRTQL